MAKVRFGDVVRECKINIDRATDTHEFYIAGEHMESENIHLTKRGRFEGSDVGPAFIRLFKPGQILYGSRRTYLKKVAVADFEGITSNTTFVLESKDEQRMLQGLLPFIMLSDSFTDYAIQNSKGSTNPYILFSDLAEYEFELPEIDAQRKLLSLLTACDNAKEAYKALILSTDELVKSQFIEIIEHALPSSYVELSEVLTQYRTTEKIVDTRAEKYISVPLYGRGITERDIGNDDIKSFTGIRIKTGQFIYSRIWARKGASGIVPPELNGAVVTNEFPVFDINTAKIDPCFLLFSVQDERFLQQISVNSLGSTSKQRIKESAFLKYKICLPPIAVQSAFSAMVEQSDKSKLTIENSTNNQEETECLQKLILKKWSARP